MSVKFTKTQEKQYTGWVSCPSIGTSVAGLVTTKDKPWVLVTPKGYQVVSVRELAQGYFFKSDKGTEVITKETLKAKVTGGVVKWTQVVRNTANVPTVMARHIAGKANGGLGVFELYIEAYGPTYTMKIPGNIFVRMYALVGGLRNIATPEQAAAITVKPEKEVAVTVEKKADVVAKPVAATLADVKKVLKAQLVDLQVKLKTIKDAKVTVGPIVEDKTVTGEAFIRSEISIVCPVMLKQNASLVITVGVADSAKTIAVYAIFTKGGSFGIKSNKVKVKLYELSATLDAKIKSIVQTLEASEKASNTPNVQEAKSAYDVAQVESVVKAACDALKEKVTPMQYVITNDSFMITSVDGSMGTVACFVGKGASYACKFRAMVNTDTCAAAKAVRAGLIADNESISTLKALASAIVTGFARIKRQGVTPVTVTPKGNSYEYRLIGKGKSPNNGEVLYVLERISTGTKTTMNRPQLIKLLEEKRVENAFVRWYKNDRQIRLRSKGGLANVDVTGLRRSSLNRAQGAQIETTCIYSEVIKHLGNKGFKLTSELELSEEAPIYGTFSVTSDAGSEITAMFSPTEWKYGATDKAKVNMKGIIPEDKRRRSMLAAALVSLITTAAKNAVVSKSNPDAPIIPATDDDFSDADVITGEFKESDENVSATEAFDQLEESNGIVAKNETELDVEEAFDQLESSEKCVDASEAFDQLEESKDVGVDVAKLEEVNTLRNQVVQEAAEIDKVVAAYLAENLTVATCIQAGDSVMQLKKSFDVKVKNLTALLVDESISDRDGIRLVVDEGVRVVETAITALGAKLQELQMKEEERRVTEAEVSMLVNEEYGNGQHKRTRKTVAQEAYRQALEETRKVQKEEAERKEAERRAAEAESEAQRLAAEEEAQRLVEEEEEADPFAGLGDDIDAIFQKLPGELISNGN